MMVLIVGSNGSGKSVFAEKLALRLSRGVLYYIATMIPYGEEGRDRVAKHQAQRQGYGFITIERPAHISELRLPEGAVVLLEDVSNLLSNVLFDSSRPGNEDSVFADIRSLYARCRDCVVVSISGLTPSSEYNSETLCFIGALNRLNRLLFNEADAVAELCGGCPVWQKGDADALV